MGVIHSADGTIFDTSLNQINGPGSAFYDADMRDVKQPLTDAYVEVMGQREGSGAVPYVPQSWFDAASDSAARRFHQVWFQNKSPMDPPNMEFNHPHNYFHLIGASKNMAGAAPIHGFSFAASDVSFIMVDSIRASCAQCTDQERIHHIQETTDHEFAHQFRVNACNEAGHDSNHGWCGAPGGACVHPGYGYHYCLIHATDANSLDMRTDGVNRMDCDDLAAKGSDCALPSCALGISVRTDIDPE